MTRPSRHAQRHPATGGQALVEFAFVLPIFLLTLFGLLDMGRFVYMNSVLSQAAREGARLAAVEASWIGSNDPSCGKFGGPVCPATVAALQSDVQLAANRMVTPFGTISNVYLSCDPQGPTIPSGTWTGSSCISNTAGGSTPNAVSVRVVLTFTPITPVVGQIVGSITTSGSATMVIN